MLSVRRMAAWLCIIQWVWNSRHRITATHSRYKPLSELWSFPLPFILLAPSNQAQNPTGSYLVFLTHLFGPLWPLPLSSASPAVVSVMSLPTSISFLCLCSAPPWFLLFSSETSSAQKSTSSSASHSWPSVVWPHCCHHFLRLPLYLTRVARSSYSKYIFWVLASKNVFIWVS